MTRRIFSARKHGDTRDRSSVLTWVAMFLSAWLLATLIAPCDAAAREIFHEDFAGAPSIGIESGGEFITSNYGQSWRGSKEGDDYAQFHGVIVDLSRIEVKNLTEGTIEFWMQRGEVDNDETPLAFTNGEFQVISAFELVWVGRQWGGLPELMVYPGGKYNLWSMDYIAEGTGGMKAKTGLIPFGKNIPRGSWFHLALTWGPTDGQCGIYLDGRRLPATPEPNFGMAQLIQDAHYMIIGSRPVEKMTASGLPGSENILRSAIDAFRIHDTVVLDSHLVHSGDEMVLITALSHDAYTVAGFSGALVEGDELTVTMEGTAGQAASFDIARRPTSRGEITLDWRGYYDELENAVALEDVDFYRVYAAPTAFTLDDVAKYRLVADDKYLDLGPGVHQSIEQVGEIAGDDQIQTFLVEDLDPYLAYFVMVTAVDEDDSMVVSTVDAAGEAVEEWIDLEEVIVAPVGGLAMAEDPDDPGAYSGTVTISGDLDYPEAVIVGHLSGPGGKVSAEAEDTFPIDTSVRILVSAYPANLKADEESTAEITVEVRNANGDTMTGHPVALSLTTTSEYTGVIGGGQFEDEVGGELSLDFSGETDLFGTVTATFTAGFAAKTAVIVARDLVTNDVGSGYVTQFIEGTTDIELIGLRPSAAKAAGYSVVVSSNRDWLTADGSSRANITAQVLKDGNPVSGHSIIFSVVGEGRVSVINSVTDGEGYARAVYTAGTRIGWVLIKATDVTVGISGSTQIELRSDAPAKVAFLVDVLDPVDPADSLGSDIPELYADGSSKAALEVLVTDINDNPNKDTEVDFLVAVGSGSLEGVISLTDEDGKAYATYVAGQIPGTVTVKVTVSSRAPTEAETAAAEDAVLTVPDFEFITE